MIHSIWLAAKVSGILMIAGLLFAWLAKPGEAQWAKSRGMPLMIGFFVLGSFAPSVWVIYAAIALAIPMLARTRAEAAALYIVVELAVPQLYNDIAIGSMYLLGIDKWVAGAIGMTIAYFTLPARGPKPGNAFDIPFLIVMVLEMSQARTANFTSLLRQETSITLAYLLPYYTISRSLLRPQDVRLLLMAICFGAFTLSIEAAFEARSHYLAYETISGRFGTLGGMSNYSHQRSGGIRAIGSFPEATSFGIFLTLALLTTLALRDMFRAKRFWLTVIGIIGVGIYSCNARSSLLALGIGLVCFDVYRRRYQSLAFKAAGIGGVVAIALMVAQFSSGMAERLGVGGSSAGSSDYRQLLWQRGLEEIAKHPWIGVDFPTATLELIDLKQGEGFVDFVNGYIFYGMIAGVPGMIALLCVFLLMAGKALRNRRRLGHDRRLEQVGAVVFAVAMLMMVACFTSGFGGRSLILFYLYIGIGSALTRMRLTARETGGAPAFVELRAVRANRSMRVSA